MERWADIPGYEGMYQVSDLGNVRSLDRVSTHSIRGAIKLHGKVLKGGLCKGYPMVALCKDGKSKTHKVHRLVAAAFVPNPEGLPEVNHRDGCKSNNAARNLEWCTHSCNIRHAYAVGLKTPRNDMTKAVNALKKPVKQILNGCVVAVYESAREAERVTGVYSTAIGRCCSGKAKSAGGYCWQFA